MVRLNRRHLIGGLGLSLTGFAAPAVLRGQDLPPALPLTPTQSEGPFYPYQDMPTDQDADLVRLTGADAMAQGQVAQVTGTLRGPFGGPMAGALIEIWQCDNNGRYRHRDDPSVARPRDAAFQGYGKTLTDAGGGFRFRTIRPVSYSAPFPSGEVWRAPHIHLAVSTGGVRRLTTQLYVEGEPLNESDFLLNAIETPDARSRLIRPFTAGTGEEAGALAAYYDLVVMV